MTLAVTATEQDESLQADGIATDQPPAGSEGATSPDDTGERTSEEPEELSKDLVFGLLSVERRRQVLEYLDENEGTATLGEVAEHIAARENGVEESQISSSQRKRVYVALYQSHLPKLADADVITYEQDRGDIDLAENAEQLFPYLYLDESGDTGAGSGFPFAGTRNVSEVASRVKEFVLP